MKVHCKDREKLLFDTVCTLADLDYDVYHATIDGKVRCAPLGPAAMQLCMQTIRRGGEAVCSARPWCLALPLFVVLYEAWLSWCSCRCHAIKHSTCKAQSHIPEDALQQYEQVCVAQDDEAIQEYFVKPRLGVNWDFTKAEKLQAMLESSIQRRFPKGLKIHIHSVDRFGCLSQLTRVLKEVRVVPHPCLESCVLSGLWS